MPSVRDVFESNRALFGTVPSVANDWVCDACLGPCRPRYGTFCPGCARLFEQHTVPDELRSAAVPMTSALKPGPWYNRLLGYKSGYPQEYQPVVAALTYTYLHRNSARIAQALGGEPTLVTIVPSKRGRTYESQPLRKALALKTPPERRLRQTLEFVGDPGGEYRHRYFPEEFDGVGGPVSDERIVVVEDAWVTGATALSAAGALLREGAGAVVVLPFGRVVEKSYWTAGHPYREAMQQPYDPNVWPR